MANDWTRSETISPPNRIEIEYTRTQADGTRTEESIVVYSVTKSETESIYTTFFHQGINVIETRDLLTRKTDSTVSTIGSVNPSYISWDLNAGYISRAMNLVYQQAISQNITTYQYAVNGISEPRLVAEISDQYVSEAQFAGGLGIDNYEDYRPSGEIGDRVLSHRTIRRPTTLKDSQGREVTKTETSRWMARGETSEGKNYFAKRIKEAKRLKDYSLRISGIVEACKDLVFEGTEIQIETGRIPVPSKPSDQEIARDEITNGTNSTDATGDRDYKVPPDARDPNNDHAITGIVLFQGGSYSSADSTVTAIYEMPYAPDDHFEIVGGVPRIVPGGARAAAEAFGRMESALDLGHAFGQNIVTGWNEIPTLDLAPLYVRIAGIEAAFLVDSCSYAWDGNGIVVSADLMLIGVTGWYGTSPPSSSWVRLPVAPSALYQPGNSTIETIAIKANSISIPGGFDARNPGPTLALLPTNGTDVFAEWRQNAPLVGPTLTQEASTVLAGAALTSIEYPYALTLPPEVTTLEVGASLVSLEFTALQIPAAVVEVAGLAPTIATGASVAVPAAVIEVAGLAPDVRLATVLDVPAAAVEVVGLPPDLVGRPRIEVAIPAATIEVTGLAPQVLTGTFIEVPTAVIELAGLAPTVDTYGDGNGATPGAPDLFLPTQEWQPASWAET